MLTSTRFVRIALTLATLALAGRLAAGEPRSADYRSPIKPSEQSLPSDLALIPGDATGFISVHPAALFDKMINKDARKINDLLKVFEETSGLKVGDLERVTIILSAEAKPLGVVRTSKPYDKTALLETLLPNAKKQEIEGKVCYRSEDKDRLVSFVDEQVFLIGDPSNEKAFGNCLKAAAAKPDSSSALWSALSEVRGHLAFACLDMKAASALAHDCELASKDPSAFFVGDAELAFVAVDYDGGIKVKAAVLYPNEESAWHGARMLRLGIDLLRSTLLQFTCEADFRLEAGQARGLRSAVPLARQLEKSLQGVEARPEKSLESKYSLPLEFSVKASKEALTKALCDAIDDKSLGTGTRVKGSSLPSGEYLQHPPAFAPPEQVAGALVGGVLGSTNGQPLGTDVTAEVEMVPAPKLTVDHTAANFRAVPKNTAAFLTIRVADLFDQMCDKDMEAFQKFDDEFRKMTGLHHTDIELFTLVTLPPGEDQPCGRTACVVTLKNTCDKDKLFAPLQKTPLNKIKIGGKECYQNDAENRLFYFIDEHTFLWGSFDREPFAACLKALDDEPADAQTPLSLALARSRDSHVFGWCDMSKFDLAKNGDEMPLLKEVAEAKTATLTLHYDGELKANVSLLFPDEASGKAGVETMTSGVKLLRSQVAILTSKADSAKEDGEAAGPNSKAFVGLLGFLDKLESALQAVKVKTVAEVDGGWSVSVACTVTVGRKPLTRALTSMPNLENKLFRLKAPGKPVVLDAAPMPLPPISEDIRPSTWSPQSGELAPPFSATILSPAEKLAVKLTVANTTKAKALLYQQGDDNKLTFCKEVPVGEAIDVPAKSGQRWIVLFPDKKGGETFVLGSTDGTWLLR